MKKDNILKLLFVSLVSGFVSVILYKSFEPKPTTSITEYEYPSPSNVWQTSYGVNNVNGDFVEASEKTINSVVHVKNVSISRRHRFSLYDLLYGYNKYPERIRVGMGSGVIISPDGYIVTNNHVIENASELEITTNNNKIYKAKIVGTDPTTDIALLKIDTQDELNYLRFGDSNHAKVGEWVLAVGNPFNLTSTVTAGIVSAKSRDLDPYDDKNQSFIQTDAAVNSGNSGGALVNAKGELIGINTAITSSTGNYVGYSFAVPSNIAKKVVDDLLEFGKVHKSVLGVRGHSLNYDMAKSLGIDETEGFYVSEVEKYGKNKLEKGDIIKRINDVKIRNFTDLTGFLSTKRPGDIVRVDVLRDEEKKILNVELIEKRFIKIPQLGISVENLSNTDKNKFRVNNGVKIVASTNKYTHYDIKGKVITEINNKKIYSVDDVKIALNKSNYMSRVKFTMVDKNGNKERYIFR